MATYILGIFLCLSATYQSISAHKIVTYWGQNGVYASHRQRQYWEKDLMEFCKNYNYDTIILSFLNVFFDTANKDNMPGLNFAFHCETGITPEYPSLFRCPKIEAGIKECQRRGKTVMMSLGGASGAAGFRDDAQGKLLAYRLYHLLLEGTDLQSIRPFGTAILNGVDLDIEGGMPTGYTAFIKELRRLEKTGRQKITIGAAPQCPYPDAIQGPSPGHFLGDVPELIDEIYVQFYNNWCHLGNPGLFMGSLKKWLAFSERTNGPKVFIGVPGARAAAGGYVSPDVLGGMYNKVKTEARLGGIMFWDASFDQNNMIGGRHFSDHVGDFIKRGPTPPTKRPVTLSPRKTTTPHHGGKTTKRYHETCAGLDDGLYPQRDCRKYIQCAGGRTYHHSCAEGLYFNPKINACDWPAHVDCKMPTNW